MGHACIDFCNNVVLYDSSSEQFRAGLKKGDKVVTAGGIYGVVDEIKEKTVLIKVDGETKLRVDKNSLVKDFSDTQQK